MLPHSAFFVTPDGVTHLGRTDNPAAVQVALDSATRPVTVTPAVRIEARTLERQLTVAQLVLWPTVALTQMHNSWPERHGLQHTLHPLGEMCAIRPEWNTPTPHVLGWQWAQWLATANRILGEDWGGYYLENAGCWRQPGANLERPGTPFVGFVFDQGVLRWTARATGFKAPFAEAAWDDKNACKAMFAAVTKLNPADVVHKLRTVAPNVALFDKHVRKLRARYAENDAWNAFGRPRDRIKPRILGAAVRSFGFPTLPGWELADGRNMVHTLAGWRNLESFAYRTYGRHAAATVAEWNAARGPFDSIGSRWLADVGDFLGSRKAGSWMRWHHPGQGVGGLMVVANAALVCDYAPAFGIPDGAVVETFQAHMWAPLRRINNPL